MQDVDKLEDKLFNEGREEEKTEEEENRKPICRPLGPVYESWHSYHYGEYDSCAATITQPMCSYYTVIA